MRLRALTMSDGRMWNGLNIRTIGLSVYAVVILYFGSFSMTLLQIDETRKQLCESLSLFSVQCKPKKEQKKKVSWDTRRRYRLRSALHVGRPRTVRLHGADAPATGVGRHCGVAADVRPHGIRVRQTAHPAHTRTGRAETSSDRSHQTIRVDDDRWVDKEGQMPAAVRYCPRATPVRGDFRSCVRGLEGLTFPPPPPPDVGTWCYH